MLRFDNVVLNEYYY